MVSSVLSGLLGLARTKYIAHVFGAGSSTDAYNAAFNLPDMINYFLVGGVASITLVNILNRHRQAGDDEAADRALSVVLVAMTVVLGAGILLAEVAAPLYTHLFFGRLDSKTAALCTHLTRILLPAQLFFFAGGALGSRLLVRKIFLYQALTPIVYNLGIILGGICLEHRIGIDSLAIGVLAGAFLGSLALNAVGAFRPGQPGGGLRFTPILNLRHPAFVEWLKLSLPLMIGVSLAMADKWILSHYAAGDKGAISLLTNAKSLFNAPLSVIGMAAGAASLPFFSSLFTQQHLFDFNAAVSRAVSRLLAVALPCHRLDDRPRRTHRRPAARRQADPGRSARDRAILLPVRTIACALVGSGHLRASLLCGAQHPYARHLRDRWSRSCSIPIYALLYGHLGVTGLAIASDLGILAHTLALAILLHRARLVSLATLEFPELARALFAAAAAYLGAAAMVRWLPHPAGHSGDLLLIAVATTVWALLCGLILTLTGSKLPHQLRNRTGAKQQPVAATP